LQRNIEIYDEYKSTYESMKKLKYAKISEIDTLSAKHSEYKQQLDSLLISYNKAKSSRNTKYDKLLELEMKAKLAQKSVQDEMTNIVEAKEHVKELRDEMKRKKEDILKSVSAIHKDKLNIFTNSIYSILNAYCE
jgi:chromosome segregation ATPase